MRIICVYRTIEIRVVVYRRVRGSWKYRCTREKRCALMFYYNIDYCVSCMEKIVSVIPNSILPYTWSEEIYIIYYKLYITCAL